jgi:hypothetical protein
MAMVCATAIIDSCGPYNRPSRPNCALSSWDDQRTAFPSPHRERQPVEDLPKTNNASCNNPCDIAQVRYSWFEGTDAMLAVMMLYDCVAHTPSTASRATVCACRRVSSA